MSLKYLLCGMAFVACATIAEAFDNVPESISASISLKVPGNGAKHYPLTFQKSQNNNVCCRSNGKITVSVLSNN